MAELFKPLTATVNEQIRWASQDHPRIATGFSIMDSRCSGGGAQGELILFTARSGVGKTTFALNVIDNVAYGQETPTVMFSLEMHGRYIVQRLAAIHSNVPTRQIERDLRDKKHSQDLVQLTKDYRHFAIVDEPGLSFKRMGDALKEAANEWQVPPQFVVIDFAELIGGIRAMTSQDGVDSVMKQAKDFARKHDVLLLMLHQVSRGAGQEGWQQLTSTSGRFGGEQSADYILAAYRPHMFPDLSQEIMEQRQNQFGIQFLKTRGGSSTHPQGVIHDYNVESMRITEKTFHQPSLL